MPFAVDFTDLQAPSKEGAFVVRRGKFFQVGEYPDKQFSLTEAEADAAIQSFTPGPLNIEHMPTIFDGKLGTVRKLWRQGPDLLAEYAIPQWLHDVTHAEPIKISSEWNRQSKMAVGGALVLNPRVKDAAMMAAFSHVEAAADDAAQFASKANADQMQRMHDQTCSMGAECGGKSYMSTNVVEFLSPDELKTVQKLHDLTATFDDCCNRYQTKQGLYGAYYSANREPSQDAGKGKKSMFEGLKKLFTRAGVPEAEVDAAFGADAATADAAKAAATEAAKVAMSATDQARFTALETEVQTTRAAFAAQQAAATFSDHSAQINTLERVFKLSPAEGDKWREVAKESPAAFAAALPALSAREPLPQIRGSNTIRASQSADTDRLQTLTIARMKDHSEDYVTAFKTVCTENPDLALSVRMSAQEGK